MREQAAKPPHTNDRNHSHIQTQECHTAQNSKSTRRCTDEAQIKPAALAVCLHTFVCGDNWFAERYETDRRAAVAIQTQFTRLLTSASCRATQSSKCGFVCVCICVYLCVTSTLCVLGVSRVANSFAVSSSSCRVDLYTYYTCIHLICTRIICKQGIALCGDASKVHIYIYNVYSLSTSAVSLLNTLLGV